MKTAFATLATLAVATAQGCGPNNEYRNIAQCALQECPRLNILDCVACVTCLLPGEPAPTCEDLPGNSGVEWNNGNGQGCDEYDRFEFCEDFGDIPPFNGEGTANEKCCACGGGRQLDEDSAAQTAAQSVQQTPSTWSDCTVPIAPTSNREITFEPAVPIKGENLIQLTGDVNIPVTGGSCATTIDWNGVTVLNDAFPVCGNSTVALPINLGDLYITALPCPTSVGAVAIDIIADISVLAPPGNYVISADCSDSNGTPLACAEVYMRL
jgi:hypothetical protein